ncbi:MAG: hypothetical protein K1X53_14720 [Candidatus Sumerlaeaceae bacterium]|nr:hypothetical protein [Candidatus Sumerlaeaceae bacterium]
MILYEDVRDLDPGAFLEAARKRTAAEAGLLMTAWQAARLPADLQSAHAAKAAVTVPDFLTYARLINTGQAKAMLALSGSFPKTILAGISAGMAVARSPLRAAKQDFWVVAEALLRYDLALLPAAFRGPVLIHPYLADFAFQFERRDFLTRFFKGAWGRFEPGFHTQQLPLALSCAVRWNTVPVICAHPFSSSSGAGSGVSPDLQKSPNWAGCRFIGDASGFPEDLQHRETLGAMADVLSGFIQRYNG